MHDTLDVERRPLETLPPAEYDRLAERTFFGSRGFLELWRARAGRPVSWTVTRDHETVAALPGVEFGRGPLGRFASLPDGCYGGLLIDPHHQADRADLACAVLAA